MLNTSAFNLKILAAIVWYGGVIFLALKSTVLFFKADESGAGAGLVFFTVLAGLVIGWIKAKFLFIPICNRNLKRIDELKDPMLWQFYRKRFYAFLCLMILFGQALSHTAQGSSAMMLFTGWLKLSIGTALLFSSHCFWKTS